MPFHDGFLARLQSTWLLCAVFVPCSLFVSMFTKVSYHDRGICLSIPRTSNLTGLEHFKRHAFDPPASPEKNDTSSGGDDDEDDGNGENVGAGSLIRLPDCLIIGVRKGGTRAVQHFLSLHPKVTCYNGPELNFFGDDNKYSLGLKWYSQQMPFAGVDTVLVEKTADYFQNRNVPERIHTMNKTLKFILVVRDPVDRLISDYYFLQRYAERNNVTDQFMETKYPLEELLLNSTTLKMRYNHGGLYRSEYSKFFANWLEWFPREQFYILDGDALAHRNPAGEIRQIEHFLNLPPHVSEEDFYFDSVKGFWCLQKSGCLGEEKGHKLPPLDPQIEVKVREFLRPFNSEFYNLTGKDFGWN